MESRTWTTKRNALAAAANAQESTATATSAMRPGLKSADFDINKAWIEERLLGGACEVTGLPFTYEGRSDEHSRNPWQPSLDRIDNSKGYTKDNVQVVVWIYNQAKGEWTRERFMTLVKALAKPLFKEAIESGRLKLAA